MPKTISSDRWSPPAPSRPNADAGNPFWDRLYQMGLEMRIAQGELEHAITGAASAQEAKNLRRRLARRIIREGYPKISPFETTEEIANYLKGATDGHTCLICGNSYRALGIHLANLHKVDLDEYRDQYRLPHTFGLACEETKALHRELLEERVEAGDWRLMGSPDQAARARQRKTKSAETAFKRTSTSTRQRQFEDADYWRVIEAMGSEALTLNEVISRPGMPAANTFRSWKASDPERQRVFQETVEALPFAKQAAMNLLGERYNQTILALRRDGKTIDEIAAIVGTERMGINERLRKLNPAHKQLVRHKTHCPKGHPLQERFTPDGRRLARCTICDAANKKERATKAKQDVLP